MFAPGEPVPWFIGRTHDVEEFRFHSVAGRYVVLCLLGSASSPQNRAVLESIARHSNAFDDENACFFGVSIDPQDVEQNRLQPASGIRFFLDFDRQISQQYKAIATQEGQSVGYRPYTLILDKRLRVLAALGLGEDGEAHANRIVEILKVLPPATAPGGHAPILTVPRVFEPEFCQKLVGYYEQHGGEESGIMVDQGGKTVGVYDHRFKRRRDQTINDEELRRACMGRIHDRLLPEVKKAFQYHASRMERYIVACYDAETGGHFQAHRDNTTRGTRHRHFAVTINLNTEQFEGGGLRFPEFGPETYLAPTGTAIVFSCSLLHEATPVTSGRRYAFLPFLYDEGAARLREELLDDVPEKAVDDTGK